MTRIYVPLCRHQRRECLPYAHSQRHQHQRDVKWCTRRSRDISGRAGTVADAARSFFTAVSRVRKHTGLHERHHSREYETGVRQWHTFHGIGLLPITPF